VYLFGREMQGVLEGSTRSVPEAGAEIRLMFYRGKSFKKLIENDQYDADAEAAAQKTSSRTVAVAAPQKQIQQRKAQ
jgi:hypothetical protein